MVTLMGESNDRADMENEHNINKITYTKAKLQGLDTEEIKAGILKSSSYRYLKHECVTECTCELMLLNEIGERMDWFGSHECEEFVSQCCGAGRHEYVDTICAQCNDHTGFECIDCNRLEGGN